MRSAVTVILVAASLLHLVPATGLLSAARLNALYGVTFEEPNTLILMRHRALLFGIVGALLLSAAFQPRWRTVGLAVGLTSTLSFVLIAWSVGEYNDRLRAIVAIDLVAAAALVVAAGLVWALARQTERSSQ